MVEAELGKALAAIVRRLVQEELANESHNATVWTSLQRPPGLSRAHFAAECRRLGIGTRDGKVWRVDRSEWEAARRKGPPATQPDARAVLEASGLRLTRSG